MLFKEYALPWGSLNQLFIKWQEMPDLKGIIIWNSVFFFSSQSLQHLYFNWTLLKKKSFYFCDYIFWKVINCVQ